MKFDFLIILFARRQRISIFRILPDRPTFESKLFDCIITLLMTSLESLEISEKAYWPLNFQATKCRFTSKTKSDAFGGRFAIGEQIMGTDSFHSFGCKRLRFNSEVQMWSSNWNAFNRNKILWRSILSSLHLIFENLSIGSSKATSIYWIQLDSIYWIQCTEGSSGKLYQISSLE